MRICVMAGVATLALVGSPVLAQDKPVAKDMALVGYDDLQGRSAYQPTIHEQNGRWIAYIGHHGGTDAEPMPLNPLTGQKESKGTSLVAVHAPPTPNYMHRIPGAHVPNEK